MFGRADVAWRSGRAMEGSGERSAAGSVLTWVRPLVVVAFLLAIVFAVPYLLLWTLFWIATESWDFEGSGGYRHWLLVKGSRLDRLGLVAPTSRPASYSVRFQEGTFPGWRVVGYESSALPPAIIAVYAERCGAMGLRVTKQEIANGGNGDGTQAVLVCEIEPYIDAEFHAERKGSAAVTRVSMRVWGSQ
jgi:hypothetical protein